jgi:predicted O-methyltransferase YrrM
LADSTTWNDSEFADGSFDSIFIDGGHQPRVVASDTSKSIRLLRSGGLCVWHDFCPHPDAIRNMSATRNVVEAVIAGIEDWRSSFRRLFWLRESFLLIGVRS